MADPYLFIHVAKYQAGIILSNALFPLVRRKANYDVVPWVTYTDPEPGRVGLTETEAREQYGEKNILISLLIGMRNDEGGRVGSKEARDRAFPTLL